jgi:hypothetical protein
MSELISLEVYLPRPLNGAVLAKIVEKCAGEKFRRSGMEIGQAGDSPYEHLVIAVGKNFGKGQICLLCYP